MVYDFIVTSFYKLYCVVLYFTYVIFIFLLVLMKS